MPAIINGPLQIHNVTTTGIVKFGDSSVLTPKTTTKSFAGSGGFNTGGAVITNTGVSATNDIDPNVIDQPIAENN